MNNRTSLFHQVESYIAEAPGNKISEEIALSKDVIGMQIFEMPIFAVGSASDPMFTELKATEAIGPYFMTPKEWLPSANTVISYFLPFTRQVKDSNALDMDQPSNGWLHARMEGQIFSNQVSMKMMKILQDEGFECIVPCLDSRFASITEEGKNPTFVEGTSYTSNWSERHVAHICGLGTFGLSRGFITEKGMSGRLGSVVTNLCIEPTERKYTGLFDYCTKCGVCIQNCPANAISFEEGKKQEPCSAFINETMITYSPRYGCGKCQVKVPCESRIPR